jgi:hypothetical protein
LRSSTFTLEQQLASTQSEVAEQEILLAVSSDENAVEFEVTPVESPGPLSDRELLSIPTAHREGKVLSSARVSNHFRRDCSMSSG